MCDVLVIEDDPIIASLTGTVLENKITNYCRVAVKISWQAAAMERHWSSLSGSDKICPTICRTTQPGSPS